VQPIYQSHSIHQLSPFTEAELSYLLDKNSLTQRLIQASKHSFAVEVLHQGFSQARFDEATALGIAPRSRCLIREVRLLVDGKAWVYARSVIPFASLHGEIGFLKSLKNSALGALLFKDPHLKRSHFELYQGPLATLIANRPELIPQLPNANCLVNSRRSCFVLKGKPLLVAETFLPACSL